MGDQLYIVLVTLHHQPPIDTPAQVMTRAKTFGSGATVEAIWSWALSLTGEYTTLTSLEIRPDDE